MEATTTCATANSDFEKTMEILSHAYNSTRSNNEHDHTSSSLAS